MRDFYDRDGRPLELADWARLQDDPDYRLVATTLVGRLRAVHE